MSTVTPSPNIWRWPQAYERLNRAADPDGLVMAALDELLAPHAPVSLAVDVGCGSGFHLPALAHRARTVVGVEPHPGLVALARRRVSTARLTTRVDVRAGVAAHLPVASGSVDLLFSHWAYFFGPGCEPGLDEADRVLAGGGVQVVVDLDVAAEHGYARWFAASGTQVEAERITSFFARRGWQQRRLPVVWSFADRDDLAAALRIEFPPAVAAQAIRETVGTTIAVPTVLRWRRADGSAPLPGSVAPPP